MGRSPTGRPEAVSTAAKLPVVGPMTVNAPPTYNVDPRAASASTFPSALGIGDTAAVAGAPRRMSASDGITTPADANRGRFMGRPSNYPVRARFGANQAISAASPTVRTQPIKFHHRNDR